MHRNSGCPRYHPLISVDEGDRIAQLILEKIVTPEVMEVEVLLITHVLLLSANTLIRISMKLSVEPVALALLVGITDYRRRIYLYVFLPTFEKDSYS